MVTMMNVAQSLAIRSRFHPLESLACLRQMATSPLFTHRVLLVLDVGLNTFQLSKPSNGRENMKSILNKFIFCVWLCLRLLWCRLIV